VPRARNARIPAALTGACWQFGRAGVWRSVPVLDRAVARRQTAQLLAFVPGAGRRLERDAGFFGASGVPDACACGHGARALAAPTCNLCV